VSGIYYEAEPLGREGKLAYLFPGEGAQYPNMLADLCLHFPEVRECFDKADRAYADHPRGYVPSDLIFPRPTLTGQENWAEGRLWSMDGAIEAVLAADLALLSVLEGLGVRPGAVVGHSSGEYAALRAAGLLDLRTEEQWAWFARELNRDYELAASSEGVPRAVLLAVGASRERAEAVAREAGGEIHVAMDNCPHQVVLAGERGVIERATEIARREGLIAERLPFDRPYHTPMFAPFAAHLRQVIDQLPLVPREFPLYSCTTVAPFPDEPADIRALLIDHWLRPVEFRRTIETLYAEGVRVFVEVGPRGNLTAFVEDILRGRPFCAVPADTPRRSGITQLNHLVGLLTVQGVDMDLGYPHRWRNSRPIVWDDVARGPAPSRPGVRLKLEAGFPEMRLSADAVREVRAAAPAQVPRHQPAQTSPPPNAEFAAVASTPAGSVSSRKSEPTPSAPAGLASGADDQPSVPAVVDEPVVSGSAGLVGGPRGFVGEMPSAIGSYFQTMERFLGLQQRVIRGCLDPDARVAEVAASNGFQDVNPRTLGQGDGGRDGSGAAGAVPDTDYPLLGAIESWTPGVGLVARRTFDLGEDRYLNDHTLGRDVSVADPDLSGLAIMPMTMSLEVLAEAASALIPGRTVTGLRDVRASRWIAFEDGPQTLEVTARLGQENGDEVAVQLRNLTEDRQGGAPSRSPVIEATVVFSGSYPQPSGRVPLLLKGGRPPRLSQESLYRDHMFHGPSWQGVAGIERINETGVVASLRVLPFDGYLRSDPDPSFVLDPAVLDAAGQVIGFWSVEQLDGGKVIFPFRLESLEIFGPRLPVGDALTCAASIRLVGDQLIRSDIDVLDAGGHPWMRLVGWEDKRFDLPDTLTPLILPSRLVGISEPWPELVAHFPRPELFRCRWVRADFPSDRGFWKRVWANRMLSRAERELFRRLSAPESRQLEWLAGRAAAKEAVRQLLGDHHGLDVPLVDIEILPDAWGRPRVDGAWRESVPVLPVVSISHTDGLAVAAAGLAESAGSEGLLGIDVEFLHPRPPGFAEAAFDAEELEILHGLPPDLHEEWVLRAWCAKEAVGKAMGRGLVEGPRSVRVAGVDTLSESVLVQPSGRSIAALPNPAFSPDFVVSTGRYGDLVVATTHRDPLDSVLTGIEVSPTVPPHTPGALHPAGKENQR
jgi:phosphopantetheine--protein transferase-like protein